MKRKIKPKEVDGVIKVDATLERCANKDIICIEIRDIDSLRYYGYCRIDVKKIKRT